MGRLCKFFADVIYHQCEILAFFLVAAVWFAASESRLQLRIELPSQFYVPYVCHMSLRRLLDGNWRRQTDLAWTCLRLRVKCFAQIGENICEMELIKTWQWYILKRNVKRKKVLENNSMVETESSLRGPHHDSFVSSILATSHPFILSSPFHPWSPLQHHWKDSPSSPQAVRGLSWAFKRLAHVSVVQLLTGRLRFTAN